MRRSGEIKWGELRLGLIIFLALGLFLWASIQGGENLFKTQHVLRSRFANVQGVVSGAPIWFQGVEVGTVKNLGFVTEHDTSRVLVTFTVNSEVWPRIRQDSRVRIQALNLFGEKFIEVTAGNPSAPPVQENEVLGSDTPTDVAELMQRGSGIVDQLASATNDLSVILARVRRGEGSLGRLANSNQLHDTLVSTMHHADVLMTHLDKSQGDTRASLIALTTTLDSLAHRVDRGEGTFGKLAKDPALYDRLSSTSARFDSALARVEHGEGNLGQLSKDEKLYENLQESLDRLNKLLADVQRNPKKYFGFSLF
jgi:phospholipid/cholesterol/gamma-HCH transport system substrate-binding protein